MSSPEWIENNQDKIRKYRLDYYYRNKQKQIDRQLKYKRETTEWINAYKETLYCESCGMSFEGKGECCDFHHIDPALKDFGIANMGTYSKQTILAEIAKCIPLCANCHRTTHKNLRIAN